MTELHDLNSPIFYGGTNPGIAEPDYTPPPMPVPTAPGGMPSAAGRHIITEDTPGMRHFSSSPSKTTEHLAGLDISVPTTDAGYASTIGATAAHQYARGSQNKASAFDNPQGGLVDSKIASQVDPGIRALESAAGLSKKLPKI